MLGEIDDLEVRPSTDRGMTPRIFEFLFARIRAVAFIDYTMCFQFILFYPTLTLRVFALFLDTGRGKPSG